MYEGSETEVFIRAEKHREDSTKTAIQTTSLMNVDHFVILVRTTWQLKATGLILKDLKFLTKNPIGQNEQYLKSFISI